LKLSVLKTELPCSSSRLEDWRQDFDVRVDREGEFQGELSLSLFVVKKQVD